MKSNARFSKALQEEYFLVFHQALIPTVADANAKLVLAHPSRIAATQPQDVSIVSKPAPLLKEAPRGGSYVKNAAWPEQGFHASRFPMLICVLEGTIDVRIGVTQRAARQYSHLNKRHGLQIWSLPEKSICLIPPDIPYDDGDRPHWCGPDIGEARSRLQWMHLIPAGALLHSCTTNGALHEISPFLCVHDPRLVLLGELLCEQLLSDTKRAQEISQAHLLALLWRIEQGISCAQFVDMDMNRMLEEETEPNIQTSDVVADSIESAAVRRAHRFIQAHLHEPLQVERIAASAYGSPSWINRQFQNEFGLSVMQYVTQCRIKEARLLLADTDFPVVEVGRLVGFPDPSYFSQVFTRWEKVSPIQFRKQAQKRPGGVN